MGPVAGEAGTAEEDTGEPIYPDFWGESGSWREAPQRWVCFALLCLLIFTWEITGVNGNSAVILMWDTVFRKKDWLLFLA